MKDRQPKQEVDVVCRPKWAQDWKHFQRFGFFLFHEYFLKVVKSNYWVSDDNIYHFTAKIMSARDIFEP